MSDMKNTVKLSGGRQHVAGHIARIVRNQNGQLVVHVTGRDKPIVDACVSRCFPWSLPECYISIRNKHGKEIALLKTLDELDPDSRKIVQEEIRDKIFNPKITRIINHKREFGITSIMAETDRGQVTFQIRTRDDVRILSPTRALFRDADGNTYEVADLTVLDQATRKWLEQYF